MTSTIILLAVKVAADQSIPITALLLPVIWLPLTLGCLGMTWILSTAGVFTRDIGQLVNAGISVLMFLSPVFYPESSLPNGLRWLSALNPLAIMIEQTRDILINGTAPKGAMLLGEILLGLIWCEICMRILKKAQPHFGDML